MKDKSQHHKATNTFVFQGFREKVSSLRVSARKFLLQKLQNDDGEDFSLFYQTYLKHRELNLTEEFQAFQREVGPNIQTTAQLVHHVQHISKCLATHLDVPSSPALQPLLDLLVAFANDIPQDFYQNYFYVYFPKLSAQLTTKEPEIIEAVFLCIVSLFVVQQKYLLKDLYKLYHVHNFAKLLSKSYPWYINELAAQSLAFLIRKDPKKKEFLEMAVRKLRKDSSQVEGVGRLVATMMKSDVVQRLHSCSPQILEILLDLVVVDELALESVTFAICNVAKHITATHPDKSIKWYTLWQEDSELVWPVLWNKIKFLLPQLHTSSACDHLHGVIQVLQSLVKHRDGALVTNVNAAVSECLPVIQASLPDNVSSAMYSVISNLFTSPHQRLTHSTLHQVVSTLFTAPCSYNVKLTFIKEIIGFSRFDTEILPLFLRYLNNLVMTSDGDSLHHDAISFIAVLVLTKQPPCDSGLELDTWKRYQIDFSRILAKVDTDKEKSIPSRIIGKISEGLKEDLSNLEDLLIYLMCLPHISPLDYQDLTPYLMWILSDSILLLNDESEKIIDNDKTSILPSEKKKKLDILLPDVNIDMNIKTNIPLKSRQILFLVGTIVEVMSHILSAQDFLASLSQMEIYNLLKEKQQYRENIHMLRALDLHFTVASSFGDKSIMNEDFLKEIYSILAPALASSNPKVRLLVVHILSLFPVTLPPPPENVESVDSMFQLMLKAELVPPTPWEYKNRLRHLVQIDAEHVTMYRPLCRTFDQAPLLLYLGQLFINFKDIWHPVIASIASYAHNLRRDVFWPIWLSRLKITSHITKQVLKRKAVDQEENLDFEREILVTVSSRMSLHSGFKSVPPTPDHMNYRELLWKAMEKFPDVCELRSKDIVPIFFTFLEEELFPADYTVAPSQDIRSKNDVVVTSTDDGNVCVSDEGRDLDEKVTTEDRSEIGISEAEVKSVEQPRKAPMKTLCSQLAVFAKFHNPKIVYQTKKLEKMFQEFLSHSSPTVQKLSFDCIMTYNHPYLVSYKESIYRILDDKSFKNAITLFSIDGSEQTIDDKHRKDFMPYLMRILYGKMHFKTGSNSSGKAKINVRKAVVLRFLAGAKESELDTFFELAFDVLMGHLDGTPMEVVSRIAKNVDPQKVVPLSRIQSALSTLDSVIEKIGNLLTDKLPMLLKVILFIVTLVSSLLERRSEIRERNVSFLKHLRQLSQRRLVGFFHRFQDYPWTAEEIDAVFSAIIWPNIQRLPDEGILSPVPLLRLLQFWAENPRYYPLLGKCHHDDPTLTPIPYVVRLLNHEKCSKTVNAIILNMVEKLLTLQDYDDVSNETANKNAERAPPIVCSPTVDIERVYSRDGTTMQNYGTALLAPHLEGLLASMKLLLSKLGKGKRVTIRDLNILTYLTEWVTNKRVSSELLDLIIPLIVKKCIKQDEKVTQLLSACSHLLLVVDDSVRYLGSLVNQLGWLQSRQSRDALCRCISAIASRNPQYKDLADVACDLNSWNPKMMDEVDFDRRLGAYDKLTEYCKVQEKIDVVFCSLLVYNNMFVICSAMDSSLHDRSSLCLTHMIEMLSRLQPKCPKEFKQVLVERLLPQIKVGLRNQKEHVRDEATSLLQQVVHKCHPHSERLDELYKLADESEEEADFFSNMKHIQRHRRARAMAKLAEKLGNGNIILSTSTLTEYILPMVTTYLFKEAYAKDDYLISSSVLCIGAICKCLPWSPYQKMLQNYLNLLSKQELSQLKLVVRVLDVVLESFHEEVKEPEKVTIKDHSAKKDENIENSAVCTQIVDVKKMTENCVKNPLSDEKSAHKVVLVSTDTESKVSDENKEPPKEPVKSVEDSFTKPEKVYQTLVRTIIPQIQRTLAAKTKADSEHKVNKSIYPEDEDIKRIPLAFALIKLMKKLPKNILDANVNNVLMKMITFLKSKSEVIRREARSMLVRIMVELGGDFLPCFVKDLQSMLTRGFQTHVLVYTLHAVLSQLRPGLTAEHVDSCLAQLVDICKEDILGIQAEEKEVNQITSKVKEARGDKSYDILAFTAEFISAECLREIILPLKDVLAETHDKKVINKMIKCLTEISSGLERNKSITVTQKSIFIYGMLNERLPALTSDKTIEPAVDKNRIERADSYLLQPEPKRARLTPKTSLKATAHILIEFALQLLCSLLKKDKFVPQEQEHVQLLDPYVSVLRHCINSEYPDVSMYALKCVNCLIKFPLPSFQNQIKLMCKQMFVILHKFSSPELTKGKVYELIQLTFRSLALIVKSMESYIMSEEEVQVLLQYVQESLEDLSQQQTAFVVLQAVIARKIDTPELHSLMKSVQIMSITCSRRFALQQARMTFYSYLLTYPMKPKAICFHINYYLSNVSYAHEDGRLSAINMISNIIVSFPSKLFDNQLETNLWFKVSEQLVKEESKENKLGLHKALKTLFERSERKDKFIDLCMKLLIEDSNKTTGSNAIAIQLGAKSLDAFLDNPVKLLPKSMLSTVTPQIIALINPSRYSNQLNNANLQNGSMDMDVSEEVHQIDCSLVLLLEVLSKLVGKYKNHSEWKSVCGDMWKHVQALMLYPHIQVRLCSVNLIGFHLAAHPVEGTTSPSLITTTEEARSLVLDLCETLRTQVSMELPLLTQISLAVIRNLIYMIRHSFKISLVKNRRETEGISDNCKRYSKTEDIKITDEELDKETAVVSSARWVLSRVGNIAYEELKKSGKDYTIVRESFLNLIAGLIVVLSDKIKTPVLLNYIIKHIARELSDERIPEVLATRTREVATLLKECLGIETYTRLLTSAQTGLSKKRLQRKARELQNEAVNPTLSTKRKKKKHESNKESKKRKIAGKKGKAVKKMKVRLIDHVIVTE